MGLKQILMHYTWDLAYGVYSEEILHEGLKNTKLNIRFHKNSRYICNENFKKMLEDGLLQGCYLNGKLIKSISEKLELKEKILEDYINFENSQFNSVISSIDKQVSRAKK